MGVVESSCVCNSAPSTALLSGEEGQTTINIQSLEFCLPSPGARLKRTMIKCLVLFVLSCFLLSDVEAWWRPPHYPTYPTYPQPQPPKPAPKPYPGYAYQHQMLPLILAQQKAAQTAQADQRALMMAMSGMGGGGQSILPWLLLNQAGGAGGGLGGNALALAMMTQGMGGMFPDPMMAYWMFQHGPLNAGSTGNSAPASAPASPAPAAPAATP